MISAYKQFIRRCAILRNRAEHIYAWPVAKPEWQFRYFSVSLLLDIWQGWCDFCRTVVISSCQGTTTRTGTSISSRTTAPNTWQRIGYEALCASKRKSSSPGKALRFRRHEPTWGDLSVLLRAIPALSPANSATLLSGFGLSLHGPKHLQIIRNACAHLNWETMLGIRSLAVFYIGTRIEHPCDIMWWLEPASKSDAVFCWLDDLEIIASQVTI